MHCLLTITARPLSHLLKKFIIPYNMAAANNSNNTITSSTSTTPTMLPLAVLLQHEHCFHLQYLDNTNNDAACCIAATPTMLPTAVPQHLQCY